MRALIVFLLIAIALPVLAAPGTVTPVYIVPSDETLNQSDLDNFYNSFADVAAFFEQQLNNGKTLLVADSPLVVYSDHNSDWFFTNDPHPTCLTSLFWFCNARLVASQQPSVSPSSNTERWVVTVQTDALPSAAYGLQSSLYPSISATLRPGNTIGIELFKQVAAHEMGHSFGLEHVSDGSIMDTPYTNRDCFYLTDCYFNASDLSVVQASQLFIDIPTVALPVQRIRLGNTDYTMNGGSIKL